MATEGSGKMDKGGGYAIAGFLYQLLGSIDFASTIAVAERSEGTSQPDAYTVTIEPPAGGDATHRVGDDKTTIQFKTRGKRGFSEREVLVEVFPDLFKAAAEDPEQDFVLQTNGIVRLSPASLRLAELLRTAPLDDALDQAAEEGLQFKAHQAKGKRDARDHFAWLLGCVSPHSQREDDRQTLATLIRRFRLDDRIVEAGVRDVVMQRLRQLAGSKEDAHQLFLSLMGRLVLLATEEQRTLTVARIFADCHVDSARLVTTVQFVARLHSDFASAMTTVGYRPGQDSRIAPAAVFKNVPVALAAPSGVGKTWALARAATDAELNGAIVVWIERPPDDRDRLRAQVTQRIQSARDRTLNANPLAIRSILEMAAGAGPPLRVCVCLDRFTNPAVAHDVITDPWWGQNGIQLMAALPAAEPGSVAFEKGVEMVEIRPFTLVETRRFLKQRGIEWTSIPIEILRLLKTPGLARQYAALNNPTFKPSDEYVLIQTAWRREPPGYVQPLKAAKAVLALRLDAMAEALLAGLPVAYPWSAKDMPALSENQVELLERFGFVRWTGDGRVQLDTDRTLSWALAEAFQRRLAAGGVTSNILEPLLQRWWEGDDAAAASLLDELSFALTAVARSSRSESRSGWHQLQKSATSQFPDIADESFGLA